MQSHEGLIRRDTSVQVVVMVAEQTITKTLWEIQFCFFISFDSFMDQANKYKDNMGHFIHFDCFVDVFIER